LCDTTPSTTFYHKVHKLGYRKKGKRIETKMDELEEMRGRQTKTGNHAYVTVHT